MISPSITIRPRTWSSPAPRADASEMARRRRVANVPTASENTATRTPARPEKARASSA